MDRRSFVMAGAAALPLAAAALPAGATPAVGRRVRVLTTPLANAERFPGAPVPAMGSALSLHREPERRFDPAAVVVADAGGNRLGYLPLASAAALSALMDAGMPASARVAAAAPGGLRVEVFMDLTGTAPAA